MYNKSLSSIYFLETKLLIVEMENHGKTVKKFVSVDLPQGLLKNHQIQDKKLFLQLLTDSWRKNNIKEKTVTLVIPEFSTFTKLLKLPNLTLSELNEAVVWQAQKFLPDGGEQTIVDWKIVGKVDGGIEILLVSVKKDLLMGYVEICEAAELFPIGVQTPSLSLTNLTSGVDFGVLIIYAGLGETVLTVSFKEKIFGTSVVGNLRNVEEIITTGKRMISHFKSQMEVKKVFLGGLIDETLLSEIKSKIGIEVLLLTAKTSGIPKDKIQEYLVPISTQLKDIGEPSDPGTLNLLPSHLVDKYKKAKGKIQVWSLTLTVTLFVWISFIVVLGSYLLVSQQILDLKKLNSGKVHIEKAHAAYKEDANKINETADKVLKIKTTYIPPEEVLNAIVSAKLGGINIISYKMDFEKGSILVLGNAANRQTLIEFKQNLERNEKVSAVAIPISSFEKEVNLEFSMSFQYGKGTIAKPTAQPNVRVDTDF